ncbi:peptidoglycan DD-metalloendopeptidase family protein [Ammonicoccus fulvus]|uniref:Peptidoglycan DD-metalloendopeptidase family protein n=1 Tax=Ammonicoccus fulvus TaxID=3138240 RepID=A0ABZ3FR02_9ACTN
MTFPGWRRAALVALVAIVALTTTGPAQGAPPVGLPRPIPDSIQLGPPVPGRTDVVTPFRPPAQRWEPGHRGVDVAATPGSDVLATADGTISFSGSIAGRNVLVIDHGEVRTTLEPVTALVPVGTAVRAGQVIGRLDAGHDCGRVATTCVHVGLRRGEDYLRPQFVFAAPGPVRLLPGSAPAGVRQRAQERAEAAAALTAEVAGPTPPPGSSGFVRPAGGPITSRFGMRRHPVLGVWKLHDGTDYGSGCGTPLRAIAAGRVTESYFNRGYGNRLMIDHGLVRGHRITSSYNHAIRYTVAPGQQVAAGQVVGLSGTTGYSTGCHLHFMMWVDGRLVNPEQWL